MSDEIVNYSTIVTITNVSTIETITNVSTLEVITNTGAEGENVTRIEVGLWDVGKWQLGDTNFLVEEFTTPDIEMTVYDTIVTITNVVE